MSAPRPEDGQRFHTELAVNIIRENLCKTNLRNSTNLTLWTLSIYFRLILINKTDKLPQTPANPANALFSERLPKFPKSFTSKSFTSGKVFRSFSIGYGNFFIRNSKTCKLKKSQRTPPPSSPFYKTQNPVEGWAGTYTAEKLPIANKFWIGY